MTLNNKKAGPVAGAKSGPSPLAGDMTTAPTSKPVQGKNTDPGSTKGDVRFGVKTPGHGGTNRGAK